MTNEEAVQFRTGIRRPRTGQPVSLKPRDVGTAYRFPLNLATGKGYVGAVIELGGGYNPQQVGQYFSDEGLPTPTFVQKLVAGGHNKSDGPDRADGEVQLDMIVAGAIAPNMTQLIYFCPNTDAGFLAGIQQARRDGAHGITISWGAAESEWDQSSIDKFETEFRTCRAAGIPVFVAAGDTGSKDSTGSDVTDFPASSPSVIGCGGTRLQVNGSGNRSSEVVWNDDSLQSATGGGVSKVFPGRQVPDVAGNADPDTGYEILVDGQQMVVGGTSAVAPLMLGLHALLWELNGGKAFDFLNLIVTNPQACFDVTVGNNGGFRAGPGRDEVTGFGVPDGAVLRAALTSGVPAPVPPTPHPPSSGGGQPPVDPLADFPNAEVQAWFDHKHDHTRVEAGAAAALSKWVVEHGV